jgi:hypothetical protein
MYIKSIKFHFNTNNKILEVVGQEAQRIFESQLERVVSVTVDGKMLFIPRSSILYIEAQPHEEANVLAREIAMKRQELVEEIKAYIDAGYILKKFEEWELKGKRLRVGYGGFGSRETVSVDEPCIIQTYQEIVRLSEKLAELVGEAV